MDMVRTEPPNERDHRLPHGTLRPTRQRHRRNARQAASVTVSLDQLFNDYREEVASIPRPAAWLGRVVRWVRVLVTWFVVSVFTTLLIGLSVPALFGYHSFVVMSGSMEPTIHVGDVVIDKHISPLDARMGDIITFQDPDDPSRLLTHRVRSVHVTGDTVAIITKGDASNGVQRWKIPADGRIGLVKTHLWRIGFLLFWAATRWGRMLLVVVPVLALGLFELRSIWRPRKRADEAAA
jgi:signal peptidase